MTILRHDFRFDQVTKKKLTNLILFLVYINGCGMCKKLVVCNNIRFCRRITTGTIWIQPTRATTWCHSPVGIAILAVAPWFIQSNPILDSITKFDETKFCIVLKIFSKKLKKTCNKLKSYLDIYTISEQDNWTCFGYSHYERA
jgi:hypothetical protein